jgi:hypothetical protein
MTNLKPSYRRPVSKPQEVSLGFCCAAANKKSIANERLRAPAKIDGLDFAARSFCDEHSAPRQFCRHIAAELCQ